MQYDTHWDSGFACIYDGKHWVWRLRYGLWVILHVLLNFAFFWGWETNSTLEYSEVDGIYVFITFDILCSTCTSKQNFQDVALWRKKVHPFPLFTVEPSLSTRSVKVR